MISPKRARINRLNPPRQRSAVATTGEHPRRIGRGAGTVQVERELHVLGEVRRVGDRLRKSEICHVLGREVGEGARVSPVTVLHQNGRATDGLGKQSRDGPVGQVARVSSGLDLSWREEDDGGSGSSIELAAPPKALVERAQIRVGVVDELLEDAGAGGGGSLGDAACFIKGQWWWDRLALGPHGCRRACEQERAGEVEGLHLAGRV